MSDGIMVNKGVQVSISQYASVVIFNNDTTRTRYDYQKGRWFFQTWDLPSGDRGVASSGFVTDDALKGRLLDIVNVAVQFAKEG